ncbi:hypothetical protein [Spirillospora sp. NPDC048824]|uniref:hypothetical protein n=1 Tax=Spirillospora sp. NPDC048824 TaxID=3364526 RepID=UPI0037110137
MFVRPRHLATGVSDEGGHLLLRDAVEIEGLPAGVYPVTVPWRRPVLLPVTGNRIDERMERLWTIVDLADELQDSGAAPYIAGPSEQRLLTAPGRRSARCRPRCCPRNA